MSADYRSPHAAIIRCDNCGRPVEVRGVQEPHYVHDTGFAFCTNIYATVDGCTTPPPDSGRGEA